MRLTLSPNNLEDYRKFLAIKKLPRYRFGGCVAEVPDEYAGRLGVKPPKARAVADYTPPGWAFDYQRAIATMAIAKRKFCGFIDCGFGKTAIMLEHARHGAKVIGKGKRAMIVSPLMVIQQTIDEARKFYGDTLPIVQVAARDLNRWLDTRGDEIGITNYEAITDDTRRGRLGLLGLDESSMLKSHYGKWGTRLIELGRGIEWKFCGTGTPAPNDRIEYANHAVFMDRFPTVNSFLARYFVNRGETGERWELKAHALADFYRSLSDWCIFMTRPGVYGWKDNAGTIPPINVHILDVPMTDEQHAASMALTGGMFGEAGGFVQRGKLARLAKGIAADNADEMIPTHKLTHLQRLIESLGGQSCIVWCNYNREQDAVAAALPGCVSMDGQTPMDRRAAMIADFQAGRVKVLVSKPKVLGFGLNLQIATSQVFSSLVDSYESYYQAVKRSNRVGSTTPLDVYIPVTDIERPMVANVLRKAARVQADTDEQERLFRQFGGLQS